MTTSTLPPRATMSAEDRVEERVMVAARKLITVAQWPFDAVAETTGLPVPVLRKLVRDGVLNGLVGAWKDAGGTCDHDQAAVIADQLAAARRPVEGVGIRVRAGAAKYGFNHTSIYKWRDDGWVKVIGTTEDGDQVVNEGDLAFARALADMHPAGHIPGRAVFPAKPRTGRPRKNQG